MFEPLFTPLFSSLFSPLIAAAQRIFITVNGVDEYFTFQNTKTFPDDFDLSIDAVLPTTATTVTLFGQTTSADHYIKVLSTGFASINIDTSIVTSTVLATKDSKQRRYGVRVVGDDFIFTEEGVAIDTVTDAVAAAKTLIINVLCQSNGADFFNNTPSDPILTDLTTASNSVAWQLNRASPATTEQSTDGTNLLTYVGAPKTELFTFNQSEQRWVGQQLWTFGDYTYTGSEGDFMLLIGLFTNASIVIGNNYSWQYTLNSTGGGSSVRLRIGDVANNSASSGTFTGTKLVTAGDDLLIQTVAAPQPDAGSTLTETSVKRIIVIA